MKKKPDSLDYSKRDYSVIPYDEKWTEWFDILMSQMEPVFEDCQPDMYHVGGTAIKGCASQPALDVLIVVPDLTCLDRHLSDLKRFGYEIHYDYIAKDSILALKMKDNINRENIHILPMGHSKIDAFLHTKNFFAEHPEKAAEYGKLKETLFKKYPKDYASYRKEKDAWLMKEVGKVVE